MCVCCKGNQEAVRGSRLPRNPSTLGSGPVNGAGIALLGVAHLTNFIARNGSCKKNDTTLKCVMWNPPFSSSIDFQPFSAAFSRYLFGSLGLPNRKLSRNHTFARDPKWANRWRPQCQPKFAMLWRWTKRSPLPPTPCGCASRRSEAQNTSNANTWPKND
jgi:hypothetical protein